MNQNPDRSMFGNSVFNDSAIRGGGNQSILDGSIADDTSFRDFARGANEGFAHGNEFASPRGSIFNTAPRRSTNLGGTFSQTNKL